MSSFTHVIREKARVTNVITADLLFGVSRQREESFCCVERSESSSFRDAMIFDWLIHEAISDNEGCRMFKNAP